MNTSSGSTGAPTVFYEDGTQTGLNWANELRIKSWFGVEPGSKEVRFLRSSSEDLSKSLNCIHSENHFGTRCYYPV